VLHWQIDRRRAIPAGTTAATDTTDSTDTTGATETTGSTFTTTSPAPAATTRKKSKKH
jgi:hypothetical protein